MDKLKKIFSPGHSKDDEVLYGNPESQATAGQSTAGSSEAPERKEHNVLRQVLNPNGANYDEVAYGKPAEPGARHLSVDDATPLYTLPETKKHEHGVLRQIFNPHGDKYDEQAFGTTASTEAPAAQQDPAQLQTLPEAEKKEHNVLRQILNPGGANYDEQAFGTTAVAGGASIEGPTHESATQTQPSSVPSARPAPEVATADVGSGALHDTTTTAAIPGTALSSVKPDSDQKSALSIKSGVEGPYAHQANAQKAGVQPASSSVTATSSNIGAPQANTGGQSGESATEAFGAHFGRDATLAGAGLAGGELASSTGLRGPWSKPNMETNVPPESGVLSSSTKPSYEERFQPSTTSVAGNPQLNTAPEDVAQATFTARSYKLTDTSASGVVSTTGVGQTAETPHVPGEFPLESGEDPHGSHIGPATAAARAAAAEPGAAGFAPGSSQSPATAAQPSVAYGTASEPATAQHDYDREAAFAGAAGAFGIGAYDSSRSHDQSAPTPAPEPTTTNVTVLGRNLESSGPTSGQPVPTSSSQSTSQPAPTTTQVTILGHNLDSPTSASTQPAPVSSTGSTSAASQPQTATTTGGERHYGRDAALAVGAGAAAGAGAHELGKEHDGTGPASKTIGPHESNVANIVDPRVQPDPEKMKTSTTAGPHQSNLANILDPNVNSNPEQTQQTTPQHHHGRDAAIAGGVGAAGVGVYEAAKHHGDTGPASNTVGPHESNVANVVDPRVQPDPSPVLDKKEAKAQEKEAKKQEKEAEKEAKAQEKAHAKELKEQEKAHEKQVKVQEKEAKKEAKEEEKARAKEEKEQEKEAKKQEKAHEKELKAQEKEAKAEEKARAKEEKDDSHHGRDAALAGGAGAAAGAGAYELGKNDTGPASKTIGPHDSNVANIVDPRVQPEPEKMKTPTTAGPYQSDLANRLDPNVDSDPVQAQQQQSHYGRGAAVAGGAGAAGIGAYEYGRNHDDTGPASHTIGPHDSNVANVVDPRVQPDPERMKESTTSGPHRSDLANRADPRVDSTASKAPQNAQSGYIGDATRTAETGAAGAGAGAGAFVDQGLQRRDTGPASKTIGPHKSNILNILDPRVKPDTELMKEEERLTTGPHRSDIANLLDPRVKSNADPSQQRSSSEQHTGRDAAIGAGAGAAAGTAAYATEQRHAQHETHDNKHEHSSDDKPKHNKLQKPRPDEAPEKQGFLSKILHPGRKSSDSRHSSEEAGRSSQSHEVEQTHATAGVAGSQATTGGTAHPSDLPSSTANPGTGRDDVLIEPHTGLPMNVGKYGTYGAGGTDATPQISGYHETDPALRNATVGTASGADDGHGARPGQEGVAGPDWDAVKKQNTLY